MSLIALPIAACSSNPSMGSLAGGGTDALMGVLTSQLGVTDKQAGGGVGSMLTLAQEKLAKGDFDQVASLVPGASKYMDMAKSLGAVTGPLSNLAGLNGALGKLGMNPQTVSKFVPTVTDYLGKAGGSNVSSLLAGVFK